MNDKKERPLIKNEEIAAIETDFNVIFEELAQYSYIGGFGVVFRKLRTLLLDSLQKNSNLTNVIQELNDRIVDNATRVQSLLKMSENDSLEIEKYKASYEKVNQLVSVTQIKEVRAKELITTLRNKLSELSKMVSDQTLNENASNQLQLDLLNYEYEAKNSLTEKEKLAENIESLRNQIELSNTAKTNASNQMQSLNEAIQSETKQIIPIQNSSDEYTTQVQTAKQENSQFSQELDSISHGISATKKNLIKLRMEVNNQHDIVNEYKAENEKFNRAVQSKLYKRDQIIKQNHEIESNISYAKIKTERALQEYETSNKTSIQLDQMIASHQTELEELEEKSRNIHNEVLIYQQKKKEYGIEVTELHRKIGFKQQSSNETSRNANAQSRLISNIKYDINEAEQNTLEVRGFAQLTKNNISTKKKEIQKRDFTTSHLEKETMILMDKANNIEIQLLRLDDNAELLKMESEQAEASLQHLTTNLEDSDKLTHQTQEERDQMANHIKVVNRDNTLLESNLTDRTKNVEELKKKLGQMKENIINTHFQTRSCEKQNQSLEQLLKITHDLCLQSSTTVAGYKAEGQRLRLILDEANKDIRIAKGEIENIRSVQNLIQSQLEQKESSCYIQSQKAITLTHELQIKQEAAQKLAEETNRLNKELEQAIQRYHYLTKKVANMAYLKVVCARLENQLRREIEFGNACDVEFSRPMNVHRWTVLQMIQPQEYKKINLIEYLKEKIEEVKREEIKLNEQKEFLIKQIKANKTAVKTCAINDGNNATAVYKQALARKDKELESMKKEIDDVIQQRREVQEAIDMIKNKLKHGYIDTANLRKQYNQAFPSPRLHTITGLDKTRLGGGFNINSTENNSTQRFFLTEAQTEDNNSEFSTPRSKRSIQVTKRPATAVSARKPKFNDDKAEIPIRPQTSRRQVVSRVEISPRINTQRVTKVENESNTPIKTKIKTGRLQVKHDEASTPRIEFHNSQLSTRRVKNERPSSVRSKRPKNGNDESQKNNWNPVIRPSTSHIYGI